MSTNPPSCIPLPTPGGIERPTTGSNEIGPNEIRPGEIRLTDLKPGTTARVVSVSAGDAAPAEVGRRLAELGFLPGEAVRIVARGFMARAPIAVRVGTGTFALRLFEAACVRVCPEQPQPL
jgi:ferrous iron transport protein A